MTKEKNLRIAILQISKVILKYMQSKASSLPFKHLNQIKEYTFLNNFFFNFLRAVKKLDGSSEENTWLCCGNLFISFDQKQATCLLEKGKI